MEIVQELPTVDYIIVPVGGGGLITGISTLAKMLNPKIKVIGAEPKSAASMTKALEKGEPVALASADTIADGTAVKKWERRSSLTVRKTSAKWSLWKTTA